MTKLPQEGLAEFLRASLHLNTILNRNEDIFKGQVTIGDWLVLKMISADAECQQKALSKKLGLSRQRVSKIIDGLKKSELVSVKTTALAAGKSLNKLALTGAGKKSLASVEAKLGTALSGVGAADLNLLAKAAKSVRRISRSLGQKDG